MGRNIAAGGNATVRGNMKVGHNLRVDGVLEAKSIKGPMKGLFSTAAKLNEAYPQPSDGWYALVGDNLPAAVYIADGGEWKPTGEESGEPCLDLPELEDAIDGINEDIREINLALTTIQSRMTAIEDGMVLYNRLMKETGKRIEVLNQKIPVMEEKMGTLEKSLKLQERLLRMSGILPFDGIFSGIGFPPQEGVWYEENSGAFSSFGDTDFYGLPETMYNKDNKALTTNVYRSGGELYHIVDGRMVSLSETDAGKAPFVNINSLCGDKDYTLSTAIEALIELETESGTTYRKPGLVIVYRTCADPETWAAKIFTSTVDNFLPTKTGYWVDFGGEALDSGNEGESGCNCEAIPGKTITEIANGILND